MYKHSRVLTILLALLLTFSLATPAAQAQAPTLRVHYQNEDNRYGDLGLWFWGDVVTPSEQTGSWPGGRTVFAPENIQPEGAYLDIALEDSAAQVGVLVIDATGFKLTPEDLLIDLPGPQMREVWINNDLEVFYENPRDIPAGHLRVRYLSADGGYEGMGVWFWRDVATPSEQTGPWPAGATPMTAQEGPLGAYVDIALAPDAREVGFLFVNRDTGEQTADYLFSLDGGTRVVYLQEGDDAIRLSP